MKNKFKNIKMIIIIFIIVQSIGLLRIMSVSSIATPNYTEEQKAIREVADAYYNKSINAQYCTFRKSFVYSPEEATSQHTIYSVCSAFTFSTYYQAFGIKIPYYTNAIIAYAQEYYNPDNILTNDVIEYWQVRIENGNRVYEDNNGNKKDIDLATKSGRDSYANKILKEYNLQVGDIVCYLPDGSEGNTIGHVMLVYEIIYDENGEPIDALMREATSKYETKTTKITKGLSYAEILNENNNMYEGTFQEEYLKTAYKYSSDKTKNSTIYTASKEYYFTILRPLLKNADGEYTGEYYYATFASTDTVLEYECTGRTLTKYEMNEETKKRIEYSKIEIEKTVDVFNNSVVNLGDTLEYTIKITNNSNKKYSSFNVVENISEYTEIVDIANGTLNNNAIVWKVEGLDKKTSIEINYKVKVKNDKSMLGKEVVSTGTVAGITSTTVKNKISNNLNEEQKENIRYHTRNVLEAKSKYYSNSQLISKIYKDALGVELNFDDMDITNLIKTTSGTQYYPNKEYSTIYLDKRNII